MALTRTVVIVAAVAVVGGIGFAYVRSGSSTPPAEAVGTSGADNALVSVTTSPMFITVENHAGMALRDVKVSIKPGGRAIVFSAAIISRIETNSKRVMSLGEFRGNDGTPLNLRIHKPQSVTVTAERVDGKPIQVDVPWK